MNVLVGATGVGVSGVVLWLVVVGVAGGVSGYPERGIRTRRMVCWFA